jgi:hypothetical protein
VAVNAERLHAIVNSLQGEIAATDAGLSELRNAVRQSAESPANGGAQQTITEQRAQLYKMLDHASSEASSPAEREVLKELKVAPLLGSQLRKRIDEIFKRNGITPAVAADELDQLVQQVQELSSALSSMKSSFERLSIGAEELDAGEVEVSFLIPRREVHNGLEGLGREFMSIKRILNPFLELSTGNREEVQVMAIASSEFEAFLLLVPAAAAYFAKALETVLNIYEKVLNIRKAKKELEDSGIAPDYVERLDGEANAMTKKEIEQFVDQLMKERTEVENPDRANELRTDLAKQTMELAKRIDHGYRVDLQARELEPTTEDHEPDGRAEQQAAVQEVLAARNRLKAFKLTGKPILGLPEAISDDAIHGAESNTEQ